MRYVETVETTPILKGDPIVWFTAQIVDGTITTLAALPGVFDGVNLVDRNGHLNKIPALHTVTEAACYAHHPDPERLSSLIRVMTWVAAAPDSPRAHPDGAAAFRAARLFSDRLTTERDINRAVRRNAARSEVTALIGKLCGINDEIRVVCGQLTGLDTVDVWPFND